MDHGFHNYVSSPEGTVISNAIFNGSLTSHYNPGFAWGDFLFSSWEIHHLGNLEFFLLEPLNQIQVNVISISYDSWWVTFPSYPSHYYPYSVSFLHNLLYSWFLSHCGMIQSNPNDLSFFIPCIRSFSVSCEKPIPIINL